MLAEKSDVAARHTLFRRMLDARRESDALFDLVRRDSLYERPIAERHRIAFYIGHLEAFDWNLLHENVLGLKSFHPELDRLFAFGIDPIGGGLPSDHPSDWPDVESLFSYVKHIRGTLDGNLADEVQKPYPQTPEGFSVDSLLNVAIEHRLMHVETLAYMFHQLPLERKIRQNDPPNPVAPPVKHRMVEIPAGVATLGLSRSAESFGWDNEYEQHTRHVPAFEIDQYMVTNQRYLEFMAAGGYDTRGLWNDQDWDWKTAHGITHPSFWKKVGDGWMYRTMFDEIPLPMDCPVYVSHAEAEAYVRWAGKALPTEEQWHRAAYGTSKGSQTPYPWGTEEPSPSLGNFDLERWDPLPVTAFARGQSSFGVHGMVGNGWEWTSTAFAPYPGFEPFPFYRGYSADFFDGKHFVMKGGSARTAACMLRPTFRNWFQAHYQYVYAGFRCVNH